MLTPTDFRYTMVLPRVLTDDELRQVRAPALVLLGEREVVYDPRAAAKRAATLIPNVKVIAIPGAGHAVNMDQPDLVNQHILEYLRPPAHLG
jgi:pimeloyl-ACP methyl ester carboxylesterase